MACIKCGFTDGHDEDCELAPPAPVIDQEGNELSSSHLAPKPTAPSLTPAIEEAVAQWLESERLYEAILAMHHEADEGLAKARQARDDAKDQVRAAVALRDRGID